MGAMLDACRDAADLIDRASKRRMPVLVAVDGRSGVGKSTFAASLADATGAAVIEGDAFYAGGLAVRSDTPAERADACIDRPKLRVVLEHLKAGRPSTFRPFDWEFFDGRLSTAAVTVEPQPVVILEGVYAAHPDLADLLDVKLLLCTSAAVRHQRLIEREGTIGPWERQWHEAEDWYFSKLAKPHRFDRIIMI